MTALARFAWTTLAWTVGVILLGALVRATGSGAGCGRSWPTCAGEILPGELVGARAVEFAHRLTSGVSLVLVLVLVVWVWRTQTDRALRWGSALALATVIIEALIGAWLVLGELVADDTSTARAISVPLHLVNTLFLLAALASVAWWLTKGSPEALGKDRAVIAWVVAGVAGMMLVAASGAVAALADTLFPAESIAQGFVDDFSAEANLLTRLRILHPVLAVVTAGVLWWGSRALRAPAGARGGRLALSVGGLVAVQVGLGVLNVVLLTPVWLQMIHLAVADLLWIVWVLLSVEALTAKAAVGSEQRS